MWVSPFRYLRITGYLLLPAAFRSLSRLSSALSAKASTLRSYWLDLLNGMYSVTCLYGFGSLNLLCLELLNKNSCVFLQYVTLTITTSDVLLEIILSFRFRALADKSARSRIFAEYPLPVCHPQPSACKHPAVRACQPDP